MIIKYFITVCYHQILLPLFNLFKFKVNFDQYFDTMVGFNKNCFQLLVKHFKFRNGFDFYKESKTYNWLNALKI